MYHANVSVGLIVIGFSSIYLYNMCLDVAFVDRSIEYRSITGKGSFHTHFMVCVMLIIEYRTVTVNCRTAIKAMFLYIYISV
jgi:hypothetical protein